MLAIFILDDNPVFSHNFISAWLYLHLVFLSDSVSTLRSYWELTLSSSCYILLYLHVKLCYQDFVLFHWSCLLPIHMCLKEHEDYLPYWLMAASCVSLHSSCYLKFEYYFFLRSCYMGMNNTTALHLCSMWSLCVPDHSQIDHNLS